MTIIYSNAEDIDCHVLRYAFENLKDVNLVEIDKSSVNWAVHVNEAISKENYLKFLYENLGITKKIKRNKRDNVYNIMVTRKDAVKLVNILYENSEIHLNRKYDSAMEVNKWSNNN